MTHKSKRCPQALGLTCVIAQNNKTHEHDNTHWTPQTWQHTKNMTTQGTHWTWHHTNNMTTQRTPWGTPQTWHHTNMTTRRTPWTWHHTNNMTTQRTPWTWHYTNNMTHKQQVNKVPPSTGPDSEQNLQPTIQKKQGVPPPPQHTHTHTYSREGWPAQQQRNNTQRTWRVRNNMIYIVQPKSHHHPHPACTLKTHRGDGWWTRGHRWLGGGISPGFGKWALCDGGADVFTPATLQWVPTLQADSTAFVHRTGTGVKPIHLKTPPADFSNAQQGLYPGTRSSQKETDFHISFCAEAINKNAPGINFLEVRLWEKNVAVFLFVCFLVLLAWNGIYSKSPGLDMT